MEVELKKRIVFLLYTLFIIAISLQTSVAFASYNATLSWDAPTTNADGTPLTDLAGYKIYYGISSGNYSQKINVGNVITYKVINLTSDNTYYFAVTAYDKLGNESKLSNEVSIVKYTLTVNKGGTGTGTVTSSPAGINCGSDCSEAYKSGNVVTLTATPNAGSTFTGWNGGSCSGAGTCSFTINTPTTVTANFAAVSSPTLTVNKSGTGLGTVTSSPAGINCGSDCKEAYKSGTVVTLTTTANTGSTFTGWSGGMCEGDGQCILTINSTTTVTANFAAVSTPTKIILDNRDQSVSKTGTWNVSGGPDPYGTDSVYSRDGATFTWYFTPSKSGFYRVSLWWTEWESRSTNVPIEIEHAGGKARVFVNQKKNGGQWNFIGKYRFKKGMSYAVTIQAQQNPTTTCADAIKFKLVL